MLIFIILISIVPHLYRINIPSNPVFDEMHYTTYASRYAQGKPRIDVHPPLGTLMYAIPLLLMKDTRDTNAAFIEQAYSEKDNEIKAIRHFGDYGDFPYIILRLINVAFGVLLPLLVYFFIRAVSGSEFASLLGAFFITFENMLLLESRLILLNPMFLTFGMASLVAMVCKKPKPILGGILFGLAMNVKWIALVFLGPLVMLFFLRPRSDVPNIDVQSRWTSDLATLKLSRRVFSRNSIVFLAIAILTFLIIQIGIQNIFVSGKDRTVYYESLIPWLSKTTPEQGNIFLTIKAFLVEFTTMAAGYTTGVKPDPFLSSEWFLWPLMGTPMTYTLTAPFITLIGNPFVWFSGTAAVVITFFAIVQGFVALLKIRDPKFEIRNNVQNSNVPMFKTQRFRSFGFLPFEFVSDFGFRASDLLLKYRSHLVFLGSYFLSLLPFILVNRATFLYHYSPALIFSTCLAAVLFGDIIPKSEYRNTKQCSKFKCFNVQNVSDFSYWNLFRISNFEFRILWPAAIIVFLTLFGFALSAPYTYGVN